MGRILGHILGLQHSAALEQHSLARKQHSAARKQHSTPAPHQALPVAFHHGKWRYSQGNNPPRNSNSIGRAPRFGSRPRRAEVPAEVLEQESPPLELSARAGLVRVPLRAEERVRGARTIQRTCCRADCGRRVVAESRASARRAAGQIARCNRLFSRAPGAMQSLASPPN